MNEERKRILGMLAEGRITPEDAETLLDALGGGEAPAASPAPPRAKGAATSGAPKFLFVKVTGKDNVDVKVPLSLVRAGLKLTSLIPPQAKDEIDRAMSEHGMSFDLNTMKPEDVEDLIANLRDMEVTVQTADGDHVRVYCA